MGVVLQAHPVVHGGADLGEGIVPGAGIDLRVIYEAKFRRLRLGNRVRRFTGSSTFTGLRRLRRAPSPPAGRRWPASWRRTAAP